MKKKMQTLANTKTHVYTFVNDFFIILFDDSKYKTTHFLFSVDRSLARGKLGPAGVLTHAAGKGKEKTKKNTKLYIHRSKGLTTVTRSKRSIAVG